ncbi:MAG TPA: HEAT repeat domain-containing protein [Candidatus Lokiarchaeia archaeon]|nr:HEAT repeat domain-containing protein [Candidatus Lokiarchaeia archaeon]
MTSELSSVLCPRDTSFLPTISQLHALADFLVSRDFIDEETRGLLDVEFDKLPTDADGRVKVRGDDIEIEYWAKKFPHYESHFFRFHKGDKESPSFELAENTEFDWDGIDNTDIMKFRRSESDDDEFLDYSIFDYEEALRSKLLADKELAELELHLATILGTEIVSATRVDDGFTLPRPLSEQGLASSPRSLPPFLRYISREQIMDMRDAIDYKGLVQALCVPDEELRKAAAMALVDIRYKLPPHFIGAEIMYLMDDPDPNVRKAAVQARSIFVDAWAIILIEKGLNDADAEVREAARENLPKAMSVWKKVSKKEIAGKEIIFDHTKIHLDESVATALGFKVGDVVKCRDRDEEGWTTLYRRIISPEQPKPISVPSIKVWRNP